VGSAGPPSCQLPWRSWGVSQEFPASISSWDSGKRRVLPTKLLT
jgi:hypothetical protein